MKNKKLLSAIMTVLFVVSTMAPVLAKITVSPTPPTGTEVTGIGNKVLGYVQWFGYAIAVAMLIYVGIKYTMASANEKADLKKGSISYVIGAIIIATASVLFGVIEKVGNEVVGS